MVFFNILKKMHDDNGVPLQGAVYQNGSFLILRYSNQEMRLVSKVYHLSHFYQREKSILLTTSNTDFSLTLEMTL